MYTHTQLCQCFLLKSIFEQAKAEKDLAVVKHMDAEPKVTNTHCTYSSCLLKLVFCAF